MSGTVVPNAVNPLLTALQGVGFPKRRVCRYSVVNHLFAFGVTHFTTSSCGVCTSRSTHRPRSSGHRWAYLRTILYWLHPPSAWMICSGTPSWASQEAQVWRRSCQRKFTIPAFCKLSLSSRSRAAVLMVRIPNVHTPVPSPYPIHRVIPVGVGLQSKRINSSLAVVERSFFCGGFLSMDALRLQAWQSGLRPLWKRD